MRYYKNNNVQPNTGRRRARILYKVPDVCDRCGETPSGTRKIERHHIDGNPLNNERENIAFLCLRCHKTVDGRMEAQAARFRNGGWKLGAEAKRAMHQDTEARSGDPCPRCGEAMRVIQTFRSRKTRDQYVYIGCSKRHGGCGHRAGSFRQE